MSWQVTGGARMLLVAAVLTGACGGDSNGDVIATTPEEVSTTTTFTTTTSPLPVLEPATETVHFEAGEFQLYGDLSLPGGAPPYPAVVLVHGSGTQTRHTVPGESVLMNSFGHAGYAVLVWDKPGSGESTGVFDPEHTLTQRAEILAAGINYLASRSEIDPDRIGLWGISQAGWVMPLALEMNDSVDFMIVVSGGGEDSIEQLGYSIASELVCYGASPQQGQLVETYGPVAAKSNSYEEYVAAVEILAEIPGMESYVGTEPAAEDEWQPWPADIDAYLNPMDVIEHTTIPVLAVFGSLDKYVDPLQGAAAYEEALAQAGNDVSYVELIEGVGHTMYEQSTGCPGDAAGAISERYVELLRDWLDTVATPE